METARLDCILTEKLTPVSSRSSLVDDDDDEASEEEEVPDVVHPVIRLVKFEGFAWQLPLQQYIPAEHSSESWLRSQRQSKG
mmetsp:Transcript_85589/g.187981  ORF Transcript_85589/g.187981 Transcript_85589/m.187981 type:complete len:82 (-) Transcript_85589:817-1062(-)